MIGFSIPSESKRWFGILTLFVAFCFSGKAQKNRLAIGTQIPMNYSVSYEEYIAGGVFVNYHFGYLTHPYVKVLFHEAEKRGLDPEFSNLIKDDFKRGISHQFQLKYAPTFLKGFYAGALYKIKNVKAEAIPVEDAAEEFDVDLSAFQSNPLLAAAITDIDFDIVMQIPGVYIGKNFPLGESRWSIYMEAAYMKIISSKSAAYWTETINEVPLVNEILNDEINEALGEQGDLFSFNLGVSYTFPVSIRSGIESLFKKKTKGNGLGQDD